MNAKTASNPANYVVLTSKVARGPLTVRVGVSARYDSRRNLVTLTLAKPSKNAVKLIVRKAVSSAKGRSMSKDFALTLA